MDLFVLIVVFIIISAWIRVGQRAYEYNRIPFEYLRRRHFANLGVEERRNNRLYALNVAKSFLKSYNNPMGELCLANENCKVSIIIDENGQKKIICASKTVTKDNKRFLLSATVTKKNRALYNVPYDYVVDNLFDCICIAFNYKTEYVNILNLMQREKLDIKESVIIVPVQKDKTIIYDSVTNTRIRTNNLLDINTASEAELSALPGISIVTAKKAIKYIEKNGAFRSTEEFIEKMKIKEVFANQIRDLICAKYEEPVKQNTVNPYRYNEASPSDDNNSKDYIPHSDNERIIDL